MPNRRTSAIGLQFAGPSKTHTAVAHTGLHWVGERFAVLRQFPLPEMDAAFLASAMRWMLAIVIPAALAWLLTRINLRKRAIE